MQINYSHILSLILVSIVLYGCGSSQPAATNEEEGTSLHFERVIRPFAVYDSSGTTYDHPFLGGFNTPRPQFVDIDGDGMPALFLQENSNQLIYFTHQSNNEGVHLQWQTDRYKNLDIGEWFRFADMDHDGDYDLLAEQPYSHIRFYRNTGTSQEPEFELAKDTLRDVNGEPIFSDRQNIPNVTDIDCDGKLDLFIGRLDGTVTRYESVGLSDEDIPQFKLMSEKFEGIEIVKQFGTMHGANTLAFYDIDNDNDQDLFWGDFFEPGLLMIENQGSCSSPELQGEPVPFPQSNPLKTSGYNAPSFTDWGGDGDVDLLVGVLGGAYNASGTIAENLYFYEQAANGTFNRTTRQFLNAIDVGNESMPAAGDIDGDGDTDLLLANKIDPTNQNTSVIYRFENKNNGGENALQRAGSLDLPEAYHYAPALGDLNGDGRDDLLLGTWKGRIAYYESSGEGFTKVNSSFVELERGSNSAPVLGDLDGDGDLDLLVGESGGNIHFYRNEGTPREPDFVLEKGLFKEVSVDRRSSPDLFDIDGDGDLDLFLGTQSNGIAFYRNTGTAEKPQFEAVSLSEDMHVPQLAAPRFADFDGDGSADLIIGNEGGGLLYYNIRR